jgi:hypothetical protein
MDIEASSVRVSEDNFVQEDYITINLCGRYIAVSHARE